MAKSAKSVAALSVVGIVHAPKNENQPVAYVQMFQGDKKVGSFFRCDYLRWLIDNPKSTLAAIENAEGLLPAPAPVAVAPVAVAPVAVAAPVVAPVAGIDADLIAKMMHKAIAAQFAAMGLSVPTVAPAPVAVPAPAPVAVQSTPAKPAPLSAITKVRAASQR